MIDFVDSFLFKDLYLKRPKYVPPEIIEPRSVYTWLHIVLTNLFNL